MVVYRPSRRRRIVLALLLLTSVTLITLDLRGEGDDGALGSVRSGVRDVLAPVQDAANAVISPVTDWFDGITSAGTLKSENRELREQVDELRAEQAQAEAAIAEIEELMEEDPEAFFQGEDPFEAVNEQAGELGLTECAG